MVLPALASVLALSVWAVATVTAQLQCVDAARVAARALARGEAASASTEVARQAAPDGATVSVLRTGDLVTVEVRAVSRLPGPWRGRGPSVDVGGRATAEVEGAAADLGPVSGLGGELP
ncbi:MAG: TadE family type IV pilus minor pilin [Actinomycetes bacterium]